MRISDLSDSLVPTPYSSICNGHDTEPLPSSTAFSHEDSFVCGDEWAECGEVPLLQGVVKEPLRNALILLPVNQSSSSLLETILLPALTWKQVL